MLRNKTTSRRPLCLICYDLTSLASVFFALSGLLLLVYIPREPKRGIVLLDETPRQQCQACFSLPTIASVFICLAIDGRTSFAASNATLQAAVLQRVGERYGVHLSIIQADRLKSLPFIAVEFKELPNVLATASISAMIFTQAIMQQRLTEEQLVNCVHTAIELSPAYSQHPANIFISADARTDVSKVTHLLQLLQGQLVSPFNLVAHCL